MADDAKPQNDDQPVADDEPVADDQNDGEDSSAERKLSQAEVDQIVKDRLARERKKFADYDELKQKAAAHDEAEAEKLSELEKANARAEAAEAKANEATERARSVALRAEVLTAAAGKSVDPEAVFEFLRGRDSELLELDDSGAPTNAAEAVDKLLENRPYLAAGDSEEKPTPGRVAQGARGSSKAKQLSEADLAGMSSAEINKARHEGRLDDLLGITK